MAEAKAESDNFEDLIFKLLQKAFESTDAIVTKTRSNCDGGLDIYVEWEIDGINRKVVFECKLKSTCNLDLRTIAANAIIAFNNRAISFIAVTNHSFSKQAAEELMAFSRATPLRIKIIIGDQIVKPLLELYPVAADYHENVIAFCESRNTKASSALQAELLIDFEKECFPDFLFAPQTEEKSSDIPFCENILMEKNATAIQAAVKDGNSLFVTAPHSIDAFRYVKEALNQYPYRVLYFDAQDYSTMQDVFFTTLCQIWGSLRAVTQSLLLNASDSLFDQIDDELIPQEDKTIFRKVFSGDLNLRDSLKVNFAMSNYIVSLVKARYDQSELVFVFENICDNQSEAARFLLHLIRQLVSAHIPCIIHPKSDLNESNSAETLRLKASNLKALPLTIPNRSNVERYVRQKYEWLSTRQAGIIAKQVGGSLDLADQICRGIELQADKCKKSFETIANDLLSDYSGDANELPVLMPTLWCSAGCDRIVYAASLTNWRLVPSLMKKMNISVRQINATGLFKEEGGAFVFAIPAAKMLFESLFTINPPADKDLIIDMTRTELDRMIACGEASIADYGALLSLYCDVAYYRRALNLAKAFIPDAIAQSEFSYVCSLMPSIIEAAEKCCDIENEIEYRILYLRILFARKRVWSEEYDNALIELKRRSIVLNYRQLEVRLALALFSAKQAMRKQDYDADSEPIKELERIYTECIKGKIASNPRDLLGHVCHQYALVVKRRDGNVPALDVYKKAWKQLRGNSLDLNRGLLSHLACMNLSDRPLLSKLCYNRIIQLLESHPENVGLPLHAYCDQAMAELLIAKRRIDYRRALYKAETAANICESYGAIEEVGRAYNMQGCACLLMGDSDRAKGFFREAIALLTKTQYQEYAWRSELNLASILVRGSRGDSKEAANQAAAAFFHYMRTQGKRLNNLIRTLDPRQLRKTREYAALLSFARCIKFVQSPFNSQDELMDELHIEKATVAQQLKIDMDDFCKRQSISITTSYLRNKKLFHIA